jgi:hypothetical protein
MPGLRRNKHMRCLPNCRCILKDKVIEMNVRTEILDEFRQVAQEHGSNLAPISDNLQLLDSGLDSLGFAVVVARLESRLGVDPFSAGEDTSFPVTFGEFFQCYENAATNMPVK